MEIELIDSSNWCLLKFCIKVLTYPASRSGYPGRITKCASCSRIRCAATQLYVKQNVLLANIKVRDAGPRWRATYRGATFFALVSVEIMLAVQTFQAHNVREIQFEIRSNPHSIG